MTNFTLEEFENGIKVYQDENFYKFTSDAIKLAKFCKIKPTDNVLDMCAGCGVVGFYAYSIKKFNKIYFNDIQSKMCSLIEKNIQINNLQNKAQVLCKDLANLQIDDFDKSLDIILCNPPYFKLNGKIKENKDVAMCRHELTTNLKTIIDKAGELLKTKGKLYLIIPANRLCECVSIIGLNDLEIKNIQINYHNDIATTCLLECVKGAKTGVNIIVKTEN